MSISLSMIVKNAEPFLADCLRSVAGCVDELVVVDTGSTDGTVALAKSLGAQVSFFDWVDDFSAARNFALSQSSCEYLFILDADEVLDAGAAEWLRARDQEGKSAAWIVETRNYFLARPDLPGMLKVNASETLPRALARWSPGWYFPSKKVRFFRNLPGIHFDFPVHETLEHSLAQNNLPILESPVLIHHHGYLSSNEAQGQAKALMYRNILQEQLSKHPNHAKTCYDYAYQCFLMGDYSKALEFFSRAKLLQLRWPMLEVMLAESLSRLGKNEELLAFVLSVPESHEYSPVLRELFADACVATGQLEKAVQIFRELLKEQLGNPEKICLRLGQVLEKMGNVEMARSYLAKASQRIIQGSKEPKT